MKDKLNLVTGLRLDVPDATAIHDAVDAELRRDRSIYAGLPQGLTAFSPTGVVVTGWTVRVNPASDQQLLVTPGIAICYERLADGTLSFGQVTAESSTEQVVVMSGAAELKGLWARFIYVAAASENRARWRPDTTPEREELFLHNTRLTAQVSLDLSHGGADTPPDANGWFKIADVDYSSGAVLAADIADRRILLYEGEATGSANPSDTWVIPGFDRTSARDTIGARSGFGFAMRVLKRLEELGGRAWYEAETHNENVRSGVTHITVGTTSADEPHEILSATPTAAAVQAVMVNGTGADSRGGVEFLPGNTGARAGYSVDCSAGPISLSLAKHQWIRGNASLARSVGGGNPLLKSSSGLSGFKGTITGLTFQESAVGASLWLLEHDDDRVIFEDCEFIITATSQADCVKITGAGHYAFRNCTFIAADESTTALILVTGAAQVTVDGCSFKTCNRGVKVTATAHVHISGCTFEDCDVGVEATSSAVAITGCFFNSCSTYDTNLVNAHTYAPGGLDRGAQYQGHVSGLFLRANQGICYMGTGTAYISGGATVTGGNGSGGVANAVFDDITANGEFYAGSKRLVLAPTGATGDRLEHIAAADGSPDRFALLDDASTTAPSTPLHVRRLLLGADSTDTRAYLAAHTLPKAWGLARVDNSTPATPVESGGGWLNNEAAISVAISSFTPPSGSAEQFWQVTGLALANTQYSVTATLSMFWNDTGHLYVTGTGDGYTYGVIVADKTTSGFKLIPWARDDTGARVALVQNALPADLQNYEISFQVFAHGDLGLTAL